MRSRSEVRVLEADIVNVSSGDEHEFEHLVEWRLTALLRTSVKFEGRHGALADRKFCSWRKAVMRDSR